jgi:hypothetical protein
VKTAPDLHIIYGWLQIDAVLRVGHGEPNPPEWAIYHPHFHGTYPKNNTIYTSRDRLLLDGVPVGVPGGGAFERHDEKLCLTAPGSRRRTLWQLPQWFCPHEGRPPLSYHSNMTRWECSDYHTILQSVGRGQEFVLEADHYPEAVGWVWDLINLWQ